MTDETSPRLALPLLTGGQMQKHVTVNEALCRLDALVQIAVVSRTRADQPTDAYDGQAWIVPAVATGADWSTMTPGTLAVRQDGAWLGVHVPQGTTALVTDEGQLVVRTGDGWTPLGALLKRIESLEGLGVGTTPDPTNPISARLNAALLAARPASEGGTGDVRLSLSKETSADVASVMFQTAFGGRAEVGLVGDDALTIKVSPDGAAWREAVKIDPETGRALFLAGALRRETTVVTNSGAYSPPSWARTLRVSLLGGGGGGAGGQGGPSGTLRLGGGGGGAGGRTERVWSTSDLDPELIVTVGMGGGGGTADSVGGDGGTTSLSQGGDVLALAWGGEGGHPSGAGGSGGVALFAGNEGGHGAGDSPGGDGGQTIDPCGPGGGGAGGSVTASDVAQSAGSGGSGGSCGLLAPGGLGGSETGSAGEDSGAPGLSTGGGGGSGGGGSTSGPGHDGGNGGDWGAGGGGGGAGLTTGGAGGAGAPGVVVVVAEG
ncbi:DUF2793 domain-containing protein [Brevundimonas sp.]|jgi:hypothetical protein|uniref:DUF2793 domain-containing protein n=1 Tax=Brevundimonas sp. TaxID=1871086 RepID=UPI002E0F262C|nr:DUF2793 domain-containing protein [Brevundimonas sp.]